VLVSIDAHFLKYKGRYFTTIIYNYSFWKRYLSVFDEVLIMTRVREVNEYHHNYMEVDGKDVHVIEIADFTGLPTPNNLVEIYDTMKRWVLHAEGSFILRVPGIVSTMLYFVLQKYRKPYAVEVTGDPEELFNIRSMRTFWSILAKFGISSILRIQCKNAIAACYVTKHILQQKYPVGRDTPCYSASSVELPAEVFCQRPDFRRFVRSHNDHRVIFVGSLARPYKGVDVLLKAVSICIKKGLPIHLTIIGDGKYLRGLKMLARNLNISDNVEFLGRLPPGMPIFKKLREADLFVLPSFSEGLPRALLEAMACGLPCIGTRVGGIPEVLPREVLVSPGDVKGLANKIYEVLNNPLWMVKMAKRNYEVAMGYRSDILQNIREEFYRTVEKMTKMRLKV